MTRAVVRWAMLGLFVGSAAASVTSAGAQTEPAALVEDVTGPPAGVEPFDYVAAGKVIKLAPNAVLTLGYVRSCWRETITGGTVTIGADQSAVAGGAVERTRVQCDGGKTKLTAEQAGKAGVAVFRAPPRPANAAPAPDLVLHGASPVFELTGNERLVVERLDKTGERLELAPAPSQLTRGRFYDLAREGRALSPGGTYRVTAGAGRASVVVKIDPAARPGQGPVVPRLVRM